MERKKPLFTTRQLVYTAVLIALNIVITRFLSIQTQLLRIGFTFIPVAVLASLVNPVAGVIAAIIADLLGWVMNPTGPLYPGLTLSAALYALVYGLFYYNRDVKLKHIIISNIITVILIDVGLNTLWLMDLYGMEFSFVIAQRIFKLLMIPIQIIVIYAVFRVLKKLKIKVNNESNPHKDGAYIP